MKLKEWTRAKRKNGHSIPRLWIRNGRMFYAQMAIFDPQKGKNITSKICLNTTELKKAETELARLVTERDSGELKRKDDGPRLRDYVPSFIEIRKQERDIKTCR